jgi:hypothetical protein
MTSHAIDAALDQEIAAVEVDVVPAEPQGLATAESNAEPEQRKGTHEWVVCENGQQTPGIPTGYTFVGSHVWPRAADPRSAAAELRATATLSSLRAILQATAHTDRTTRRSPNREP